jgi:hypothetical protein
MFIRFILDKLSPFDVWFLLREGNHVQGFISAELPEIIGPRIYNETSMT